MKDKPVKAQTFNVEVIPFITNHAMAGDQLPTELKLLDFGVNTTTKGPVRLTQKTRDRLPQFQRERGFDRVALDFEHNTLPGTDAYKASSEPRPVAAFGVPQLRADGLYLSDIVWTPDGKKSARNFVDISPAVQMDADREVLFLHSAGLVRQGAVENLSFYSVTLPASGAGLNQQQEDALVEKILTALRKGLGLAETATETDIQTALTALMASVTGFKESITALTALTAKLGEIEKSITTLSAAGGAEKGAKELGEKIVALTAKVEDASTKITTFQAEIEKRDRSDLVAQACREGKVVPLSAEQVATTPVTTLRDMVKNLAVTVPLEKRTPVHVQEFSVSGDAELTAMQKEIAKNCGIDPAKLKSTT